MLRIGKRALGLSLFFGLAVVASQGCKRNPATEYMASFSTQVQVPKQFKTLEVSVWVTDNPAKAPGFVECHHVEVVNGIARLPKTFGIYKDTSSSNMMVSVVGYTEPVNEVVNERFDCTLSPEKSASGKVHPRVLRRSRQNYRDGKILYLPMPLKYACFDVDCLCADGQDPTPEKPCQKKGDTQADLTCVAGRCVNAARNALVFRDYSPELAAGDSSACFSVSRCMADAVEPKLEDAEKCIYSVPGATDGMNVRAIYDGFVTEMLDVDGAKPPGFDALSAEDQKAVLDDLAAHEEGFTIIEPGKFRLAQGLCDLTKTTTKPHRIVALAASRSCPPKPDAQPLCDEGTDVLIPAASRVTVLLDRSASMQPLLGKEAVDQALRISLNDPVFTTTNVGFKWLPGGDANACPTPESFTQLDVGFAPALQARDKIIDKLKAQVSLPPVTTASVDAALSPTGVFAGLRKDDTTKLNRLATVVLTNNDVSQTCTGVDATASINAEVSAEANTTAAKRVRTYVIELGTKDHTADGDPIRTKHQAALAAMGTAGAATYDATSGDLQNPNDPASAVVGRAMSDLIRDLSSCLYEKPESITDTSNLKIGFTGSPQEIPFNGSCSEANAETADGWNVEANGSLIRICGQSCTNIRNTLQALSANSAQRRLASLTGAKIDVPFLPPAMMVTATVKNK